MVVYLLFVFTSGGFACLICCVLVVFGLLSLGFCIGGVNSVAYDYFYWLCLLVLWLFTYCLI